MLLALIIPLKRVGRESLALSTNPERLEVIARSRPECRTGRKLSPAEMKHALSESRLLTNGWSGRTERAAQPRRYVSGKSKELTAEGHRAAVVRL